VSSIVGQVVSAGGESTTLECTTATDGVDEVTVDWIEKDEVETWMRLGRNRGTGAETVLTMDWAVRR
jgi:hypothetical protein